MYNTLLVDDNELYMAEIEQMKIWGMTSGFQIAGKANGGTEALDMLRVNVYDLVLTDIRMPGMDGIQLLQEIKANQLCSCVVLLSEHGEFSYARQGIVFGAFDYLVKPVKHEEMDDLFNRARMHLMSVRGNQLMKENPVKEEGDDAILPFYPSVEEKMILNDMKNKNSRAAEAFGKMADHLYAVLDPDIYKGNIILKRVYLNVITSVFQKFAWIRHFISVSEFGIEDFPQTGRPDMLKTYCIYRIKELIDLIVKFDPIPPNESTIRNICSYILENSESEIRLKTVADKFFINYTYLSNMFRQRVGMNFNDYITMVKMARAKYLFKDSRLKTAEVCRRLGYNDTEYFGKLFKKYSGHSPTDFKKVIGI